MQYTQSTRGIFSTGLVATLGAIILNVVFLYLSHQVFGIWPHVTMGQSTELIVLGYPQTIIATLVPGLVATGLYWLLVRFAPWPNIIFAMISFLVLVLSFFGPFNVEIPGYEHLVLIMMHILPALAITPTLMIAGLLAEDDCCDDCDMEEFCDDDQCEECIIICDECGEDDCEEHIGDIVIEDDCVCDDDEQDCCGEGCCRDTKNEQ